MFLLLYWKPLATSAALLIALFVGAFGGYRYADGRCAIERMAEKKVIEEKMANTLELARKNVEAANDRASTVARELAKLDQRQTKERIVYAKAPSAPDCRLDAGTFGLLIDQIRRANGDSADGAH